MNGQAKTESSAFQGCGTEYGDAARAAPRRGAGRPPPPRIVYDALVLRAPFSGVENAVAEQAEALARLERAHFRCTILWPRSLRGSVQPEPTSGHAVERCGPCCSSRVLRLLWEQVVLPTRLRRSGVDLLHAPAYLAPLGASCPVVLTVYDLHALDHPERCRSLNRWNYRLLLPYSIRKAARIIVPSDHTRDAVLRRFPSVSDRVRVIPLGIHPRFRVLGPADRWHTAPKMPPGLPQHYLLCVGNIEPRKHLSLAVEALAALRLKGYPELRLVVVGHATMGDPAFDAAIRHHGLEAAVTRLGHVPEDVLPRLYADAAALVFPSVAEGFGLPPLEAMACGCPVVCSDATALRQTAGDGAMYFEPRSAEALAHTVVAVLSSDERREDLRQRALRHLANFQWPALIQRVANVYSEVLGEVRGSGSVSGSV